MYLHSPCTRRRLFLTINHLTYRQVLGDVIEIYITSDFGPRGTILPQIVHTQPNVAAGAVDWPTSRVVDEQRTPSKTPTTAQGGADAGAPCPSGTVDDDVSEPPAYVKSYETDSGRRAVEEKVFQGATSSHRHESEAHVSKLLRCKNTALQPTVSSRWW